ncbi:MAG: hypothetical protein OXU50_06240 [Gammaproteobacteria bacterium]|nr:hypothetical protein [Gammaproteobacteria bacterium]
MTAASDSADETAPAFHFDPQTLNPANRGDGVSAMLRVRDGAEFLQAGLESCLDIFDEVVAVHHQCSDATPQILHDLAKRHPDRLKVYEYPHEVVPPNTAQHAAEGADSLHTIAALCNYALSKTTRRVVIKHDADHIYIRPNLARAVAAVRRRCDGFVPAAGVNLARAPDGAFGVSLHDPLCGAGGDYGFFPVSEDTRFVHNDRHETARYGPVSRSLPAAGTLFWHMKQLQKHCGLREYRWRHENNLAELHRRAAAIRDGMEVLPLDGFIDRFGGANGLLAARTGHPLFRNRLTRPLAWHGVRLLNRAGVVRNLPLYLSLSYTLERDLRGASLPQAAASGGHNNPPATR